jgi:O-ureido-D-serine cyclo-ligase
LLRPDEAATDALFAAEAISPRQPTEDERSLAESAMLAATRKLDLAVPLLYARVDVIRDADGEPRLLELELTEPSLFLTHAAGQADHIAALLVRRGSTAC